MTIPESARSSAAPGAAAAPPPRRRRNRPLWVVLTVVVALVLTFGIVTLVDRLVNPPSALPAGYARAVFTVSPNPTAQQMSDAAAALEADVAHLGGSSVTSAINGSKIEIGVEQDEATVLVKVQGRRLTPRLALVVMDSGTGPLQEQPALGDECYNGGYFFCDADRQTTGVPGEAFLHGKDIADATAAADSQGGTWSVTVRFTDDGKRFYNQAMQAQTEKGLVTYAIQLDQAVWSMTPLTTEYKLKPDGRIPNLTDVEAKRIAAMLRLSRSQIEMYGDLKA